MASRRAKGDGSLRKRPDGRWEGMEDLSLSNRVVRGIHMVLHQALQQAVDLLVEDRKTIRTVRTCFHPLEQAGCGAPTPLDGCTKVC